MKRTVLFLAAAILLGAGLWSCDKEDKSEVNNAVNNGGNNGDNNGGDNGGGGSMTVQWVDLGLPSGLLWADRNLGADNPEDYGNYYAWGETSPKEVYEWSTYAYGSANDQLTKYCNMSSFGLNGFTDNRTTLEASDDAATANIGGGARTPTRDEWQELMENTTSTWTTRNGIHGRLLTASNGNCLFLPASGYRISSNLYYVDENGCYWSSTLVLDYPSYAWDFDFVSFDQYMFDYTRNYGFSVRAVRGGQQ